jgi:outer membrane protein OmpA-like peptidoglycan-associated protein
MVQNSVGYGDAVVGDLADDVVNGGEENGMAFDAEAGIMLQYQKFRVGLSSAHLFESGVGYNLPDDRGEGTFERIRQFSAYTSYEFDLSDNWELEPFVMVRNQGVESFQFEVNALTTWKETLYLGLGYRQEAGIIGRVGFQITDQIVAAYAYEMGTAGVASYSGGSHEFMLGYKLGKRAKGAPKVADVPVPVAPKKVVVEKVVEPIVKEVVEAPKKVVEEIKEVEKIVPPTPPVVVEKPKVTPKVEPVVEKKTIDESVFDKKIVFSFEGTNIPDDIKKDLDLIAKELVSHPNQRVRIRGHTCDMGNDEVNTTYSNQRANTVKTYLLKKGVKANQMEIKAVLDREPLVPNTSLENRKKNRRAEIELIR